MFVYTHIVASYSNADAHRVLNIPPTKTTIVHGVAGVGKVTLVRYVISIFFFFFYCLKSLTIHNLINLWCLHRAVCHTLGYNLYTLSIATILIAKDQADDESFANINPIKTIFNKAKMSVPVVVMVKDLDLLGQGELGCHVYEECPCAPVALGLGEQIKNFIYLQIHSLMIQQNHL